MTNSPASNPTDTCPQIIDTAHSLDSVVDAINAEPDRQERATLAAWYAYTAADDAGYGITDRNLECHLDVLSDAGALYSRRVAARQACKIPVRIECIYCGVLVEIVDACPVDADDGWEARRQEHAAECEWVRTRAHQHTLDEAMWREVTELACHIVEQMSDDDRAGFNRCDWEDGISTNYMPESPDSKMKYDDLADEIELQIVALSE